MAERCRYGRDAGTFARVRRLLIIVVTAAWWSCSGLPQSFDAGTIDADAGQIEVDAGVDAGEADAGPIEIDAGLFDAGPMVPLAGFGNITGACGPLALTDLESAQPSTFDTTIDFQMMAFDAGALSDGGARMYGIPNLGGSSIESEVFAYEVLYRCELAELVATEAEVTYSQTQTKKTDLVVRIEDQTIGVSVARAFKFPPGSALSVADARSLLEGKFSDILISSQNVSPPYVWRKQILHVLAYDETARAAVIQAAMQIDPSIRADTILYVTRTDGEDAFIY